MEKNCIQTFFRKYGETFRNQNNLSVVQLKAMRAIETCATESSGFHSFICENCGHTEIAYNSCRNRHCPHCQGLKQEIWVDKVKSQLLPVKYVHVVFTLPEFLNEFVLINHKLMTIRSVLLTKTTQIRERKRKWRFLQWNLYDGFVAHPAEAVL